MPVVEQDKDHPKISPTPLVNRMLDHPMGAYKWHKLYDPSLVEKVPGLYEGGKTDAMVAAAIGIAKSTLYDWIKQYPAFAEAVKYGKTIAESYMTSVGIDAVDKERKINDKVWHTLMRNCYGYDKAAIDPKEQEEKDRQEAINNRTQELLNGET